MNTTNSAAEKAGTQTSEGKKTAAERKLKAKIFLFVFFLVNSHYWLTLFLKTVNEWMNEWMDASVATNVMSMSLKNRTSDSLQ